METFLGELSDHVRALSRDVLALETASDEDRQDILKRLFRTAHGLKGAASAVQADVITRACHRLEEMLGRARDGEAPLSHAQIQLLLESADALEDAGQRLRERSGLSGSRLEQLLPRLSTAAEGDIGDEPPAPEPPTPTQTPQPEPGQEAPPRSASATDSVVRLPAEKLDRLLLSSGELLIARSRAAARQSELEALTEPVDQARKDWDTLHDAVRRMVAEQQPGPHVRRRGGHVARPLPRDVSGALARTREGLRQMERDVERLTASVRHDHRLLEHAAVDLSDQVRNARMLPFAEACEGLSRTVRDLSRSEGKQVGLSLAGGAVAMDRSILAGLRDPLLHMVRNAVVHGIELPAERAAAGKPSRGEIAVSAEVHGDSVVISISDDGRGLDLSAVRRQAGRRGIEVPGNDVAAARLIFSQGISTAAMVTELSGRGVGLDAVRDAVSDLHGTVDFAWAPGRGMRFTLTLPLTLATARVLLVRVGSQVFAIPSGNVYRLLRVGAEGLKTIEGREMVLLGEAVVPVVSLAWVLGVEQHEGWREGARVPLVVISAGERRIAVAVDELVSEQEVVIKPMGPRLRGARHFAGATLLPTGRVALILAAGDIIDTALRVPHARLLDGPPKEEQPKKRLLVAEDSVTTRTLVASILEAAGYEVATAADGAEAWQKLQMHGADLVVADVEMPQMDGFALTETIRSSRQHRKVPVVLVTALESERDRTYGISVRADAYLPKSNFDQRVLLETIEQLL